MTSEQAATSRSECVELIYRAAMLLDSHDADGFAALFTEDGEFIPPSAYPGPGVISRDLIRQGVRARGTAMVSRHVTTNVVVDLIGEGRAVVSSYWVHFRGMLEPEGTLPLPLTDSLRSMGEYRDELVREEDGWRICRRVAQFTFGGS